MTTATKKRSSRWQIVLLVGALLAFALGFQGSRGLWEPDEGRYTDVALEMLRSGDYVVPRLHDERTHFTKPPLTYWAIASSVAVLGHSEWAVRLPNAIAFALTVLLLFHLGRVLALPRPWLPAVVYATMVFPYLAANVVTTDTLLALWETLAVTAFATAALRQVPTRVSGWITLMWAAFGLAFLTKGPPGLLPLLAIILFQLIDRPLANRVLFAPPGLVVFFAVGFSWYLVVAAGNPDLFSYFIRYELIERVASDTHHRNAQWYGAFKVYLPTLLLGGLPWVVFPMARLRPRLLVSPVATFRGLTPQTRFLVLWVLVPLVVFFASRSRLPLYVLPLAAPLAVLASLAVPERFFAGRRCLWLVVLMVVSLLAARWYAAGYPSDDDNRRLAHEIGQSVSGPVDEVVFVDKRPRYGLSLYLDAEIERVCLVEDCGDERFSWFRDEGLGAELDKGESDELFLVEDTSYSAFSAQVEKHGWRARRISELRGDVLCTLERAAAQAP